MTMGLADNVIVIFWLLILATSLYDIFKKKWIFRPINGGAISILIYLISPNQWWISLLLLVFFYGFEFWRQHKQ